MRPPFADLGPPLPLKLPKSSAEQLRETRPFKFRCCSAKYCSVSGEFRGCGPRWLTSALKRFADQSQKSREAPKWHERK
jgi:hypothetical protein